MTVTIKGREYLWAKLRHGRYGGIDVVGFAKMPSSSVLGGQIVKCFIDNLPTEEEAKAKYPQAEGFTNAWSEPQVGLNHLPGEDDPVPGGMYPDDIGD